MNKLRVIDLLNKIANGEEVRFKIVKTGEILNCKKNKEIYSENFETTINWSLDEEWLNYEVEIIEEDKKIEHLDIYNCFKVMGIDETGRLDENFQLISDKLNEIIDKINEVE